MTDKTPSAEEVARDIAAAVARIEDTRQALQVHGITGDVANWLADLDYRVWWLEQRYFERLEAATPPTQGPVDDGGGNV